MTDINSHYQNNFGEKYAQTLPTLGEAIVEVLQFFQCTQLYGVGGDFAANLIAAFKDGLQLSPSSNEMHAGFNACGHAEINGIGAALTTYTVGSLPCTSAAALAITEKLPVIFISGAPGESEISTHTIHHTVASSSTWRAEYDCALESFRALGMKAERLQGARAVGQPNMAAERFFQLVVHAYLNKEPVFIEIPRDLVFQKTQALALPESVDLISRNTFVLEGESFIAEHIVEKLKHAQYPLVFIGENVKLNRQLREQLMQFCHKFNIPYATTWFAKGLFDEFDSLCLGTYNGVFSSSDNRHYIEHQADYIIEVDTSIHAQDTSSAFNTGTHEIDSFSNKTVIKGTVQNQQEIINIFSSLLVAEIDRCELTLPAKSFAKIDDLAKFDFHNLCSVLNHIQSNSEKPFIYLPEIGNSYFASYGLTTKKSSIGRSWLTNPWYAAMGTSLPYARTVCKTLKQQQSDDVAVLITGDGGFHFQLNELIHFQKEQLNLIVLYMRNDIYHLGKSGEGEIYHCSTPEFDVLQLISAYGGKGHHCETVGQFTQIFEQAVTESQGITLIEVPADLDPQYQCDEIQMLNLYIQAQNGNPEAMQRWQKLKAI
ncbi:thiamine pyrophosphate-dependent enzyme [Thalassotalea sp. ND16A]|uniref:thiamine pyrophosphate-dependent enzyme n=1 Tax=Thalassotalea sp. ND16A TaxID=1535422 RepID=UPI00051A246F|nr:thiamine pyrophosphate-dependent enzyme [Thalassotalea sp. ND16A]KGJ92446.1 Pyruvate decarboxylase [Thalassotalea sp. ND16A]